MSAPSRDLYIFGSSLSKVKLCQISSLCDNETDFLKVEWAFKHPFVNIPKKVHHE